MPVVRGERCVRTPLTRSFELVPCITREEKENFELMARRWNFYLKGKMKAREYKITFRCTFKHCCKFFFWRGKRNSLIFHEDSFAKLTCVSSVFNPQDVGPPPASLRLRRGQRRQAQGREECSFYISLCERRRNVLS